MRNLSNLVIARIRCVLATGNLYTEGKETEKQEAVFIIYMRMSTQFHLTHLIEVYKV